MDSKMDYEFKSEYIKQMVANPDKEFGNIKDFSKLNFSKVIEYVLNGASKKDIQGLCSDINSEKVKLGMDSSSVKLIIENQDNENVKELISGIKSSMSIDISSLKELGSDDFQKIQELGCKVDKVYVNSGYDEAAARGYNANVYNKIISEAEKMVNEALKKLPKDASEQDRFMAIYNAVLKNCKYDYSVVEAETRAKAGRGALTAEEKRKTDTSRNLEGFFIDRTSICAGTADVLKQLCEMNGIEAEYVQGQARPNSRVESCLHAWVKVKLDGKWYNADPTWDANKVGKPYEFCLKRDSEFRGHNQDGNYQPTYVRDSNGRAVSSLRIEYHASNDSYDSSDLEDRYYTSDLGLSRGRALTSEERRALNTRPDNSGVVARSNSILEMIINAILNFGRWSRDKVGHMFKKNNISKTDIEKISDDKQAKEYAKSLHVDLDESSVRTSLGIETEKKDNSKEDKSR